MTKPDTDFEHKIRKILDQSVEDLDAGTLAQISRLKYRAMDAAAEKKTGKPVWVVVPVLVSLLFIVLLNVTDKSGQQLAAPDLTEIKLLTGSEALDFYDEDVEFYEWCSEVLAREVDMPDRRTSLHINSEANHAASAREGRTHFAEPGIDRVSRLLRG